MNEAVKLLKHLYFDRPKYFRKSSIKHDGLDQLQRDIIRQVSSKGYYILEDFFSEDSITLMRDAALKKEQSDMNSDTHLSFPDFGVERYLKFDSNKTFDPFYNSYFDDVGKNYLGGLGVRYQSMFERKGAPSKKSSATKNYKR